GATLAVRALSYSIGGVHILDDVSLDVAAGEFVGVIGPNGAGKTTLFNLLSGVVLPSSGTVRMADRDITRLTPHSRATAGLGRTFQTSSVFPALSAVENVRLAAEAGAGARLWGPPAGRGGELLARARHCLERVGLSGQASAPAGSLSHGEKRKLELAIVLAGRPQVLLLDEPMAGLGMEDVPEVVALIRDLHADQGITVLMVEHHMEVILGLADRIAVMHHGSLLACDTPDAVMADPAVQSAYLGEPL
ncbi:MAG TPA: ABC transporter ATP-binding protein, partial [Nocardioidaceae bacterium]|nr:ABC transporter ATP-binding protein [Nocardioidaceae bacterium]